MSYWRQFDFFDPKEGQIFPYPFHPLVQDIVFRARAMLRSRSKSEIVSAAQIIDWIIQDFFEQELNNFIQEQLDNNGWAKGYLQEARAGGEDLKWFVENELSAIAEPNQYFDYHSCETTTEVQALKECIEHYDIEDDDFPNATEHECFAVLALWMVADCIQWSGTTTKTHTLSSTNYSLAGESALKAMDAVCYAEHLKESSQLHEKMRGLYNDLDSQKKETAARVEKKVAQRSSEIARKAAYKSHEEHHSMKRDAIEYYEMHKTEFASIEDAARNIAGKVIPVVHRTVVKWISEYLKTQSASKL